MTWAFWLSCIYEKPSKGKSGDLHLSYGSVAYFNSLVALADAKVNPKSDRARLFFMCRDFKGSSEEAKWLQASFKEDVALASLLSFLWRT